MSERDKLIEKLGKIRCKTALAEGDEYEGCLACFELIADFILADRVRIVELLIKALPTQGSLRPKNLFQAAVETLKLAGVSHE